MIRYTVSKMTPQSATTVTVPCAGVNAQYYVIPRGWDVHESHIHLTCVLTEKFIQHYRPWGNLVKKVLYPRTKVTYTIVELPTLLDIECLSCDWLTEQPIGVYRLY